MSVLFNRTVRRTSELERIVNLPRRTQSAVEFGEAIKDELTELLKTPQGTQKLRAVQAAALHDIGTLGGLFGPIPVGFGKCGRADVEVYDPLEGRRRISEVGNLRVLTQKDGKLCFANAVAVQSGRKPCLELELKDGSKIGLSYDHPVLTHRGWLPCSEIESTDLVAIPRLAPAPEAPLDITDREVILCAYLLADGGCSQAMLSWTNARPECQGEMEALWPEHRIEQGRGCKTYTLHKAKAFRDKWGVYGLSKDKRVHPSFWRLSDRQVALFLHRFFSCDGYYEQSAIATTLASERLIDDLKFLLLRLGIHARKGFKKAKLGDKAFNAWRLSITGQDAYTFIEKVGPLFGRDTSRLKVLTQTKRNTNTDVVPISYKEVSEIATELNIPKTPLQRSTQATHGQWLSRAAFTRLCAETNYQGKYAWLATSDLRWEKVKSLTEAGARDVYDLSVPGYGCFIGDGIVVHNTLISLLAPYVLDAQRPLLILPAALIKKTNKERAKYAEHWRVPNNIQLISYEMLGRVQAATFLEEMNPDLIVFDEVHRAKNKRAAVTRRLIRYMRARPNTTVVALSGTVMRKSLLDFGHILRWCLKKNAPIPETDVELEEWAQALDERVEEYERADLGALKVFSGGLDDLDEVRRGFKERLVSTPGVVAVTGGEDDLVTCSLTIRALRYNVAPVTEQHFAKLRKDMLTPDDWQLMQAVDVWRHARELSLGLHYIWSPRPPEAWRTARRNWNAFVRETLSKSRTLDSELQVVQACDAGRLPNEELEAWRRERDMPRDNGKPFTPNVVAMWHDNSALKVCLEWMKEPGIVWTEHDLFARRLAEMSGCKYYGAKGLTDRGEFIDDADPTQAVILSIDANKEGRNLQHKWSRNLVTAPPEGADIWQQMLGRTHRPGQIADEVEVDVLLGCKEHANAWRRALSAAEAIRNTTGADSKLLLADVDWPSEDEIACFAGARWR